MARKYELKRRAERRAETRRRIVQAAVDLHTTVGPVKTSTAAIAERAGVQRHTVYAHFADDTELYRACSQHWRAANPFPDGERWWRIPDAERRLRAALLDLYAWYERVEPAMALFRRDASLVPAHRAVVEAAAAERAAVADRLAAGFGSSKAARAAVGHALEFETWRSLCRGQGLSRSAAVELMVSLAAGRRRGARAAA
jgi:AcrR family transcriptional regulator